MDDLTPGMVLTAKGVSGSQAVLWVGLCAEATAAAASPTARLEISGLSPLTLQLTPYRFRGDDSRRFYHGHQLLSGLEDDHEYEARASEEFAPGLIARCRFRTLPTSLDDRGLRLVLASCYDADNDPHDGIAAAFGRICAVAGSPHATLLVGDQVYLDAPWHEFRRFTRDDPRRFYLSKYWSAWGSGVGGRRLAGVVTRSAAWYLPDDHEFWNNFPHATPLALHSFRNWGQIFKARLSRAWHRLTRQGHWPDALVQPPDPSEWDTWSRAAFELFGSFQTPADSREVSAGAADDQAKPPPRTPAVQSFDVEPARFVLVDTRTRRSRSARAPDSKFAEDRTVEEIVRLAREPEAGLFFLVVAQPMFRTPRRYRGAIDRLKAALDTDRGLEDYPDQFRMFWDQLVEARGGRPLVVLAGDVHRSSVAIAEDWAAAEIISSPMALVSGVATWERVTRLWSGPKPNPMASFRLDELVHGSSGSLERLVATDIEGLAFLELVSSGVPDEFFLTIRWQARSESAEPPEPLRLLLTIGSRHGRPGSVSVAEP